jgi:hypothetical protein
VVLTVPEPDHGLDEDSPANELPRLEYDDLLESTNSTRQLSSSSVYDPLRLSRPASIDGDGKSYDGIV